MNEDRYTEEDIQLEKAFVSEFECPVCTEYILPPIRQCLSGHCFCSNCFENIRRCGLCRSPKSEARCFVLEKIQALLTFTCRYADAGCDYTGKGSVMNAHQSFCKFSYIVCPLRFNDCQWRGNKSQLVDHCKEDHFDNIFFQNRQKLLVSKFTELMDRHYYIIFHVFNNIFRLSWDLKEDTGVIRFAVYCLGRNLRTNRFSFEVSVLFEDTCNEIVTLKGPCFQMKDDSERFIGEMYLIANYDMIKQFCDRVGNLNYTVKIINNF